MKMMNWWLWWWLRCDLLPSLRRSNQRTFEGHGASWSTNRSAIWEDNEKSAIWEDNEYWIECHTRQLCQHWRAIWVDYDQHWSIIWDNFYHHCIGLLTTSPDYSDIKSRKPDPLRGEVCCRNAKHWWEASPGSSPPALECQTWKILIMSSAHV